MLPPQAASPACTELETVMLDWLGKMLRLPEAFLAEKGGAGGGVIQVRLGGEGGRESQGPGHRGGAGPLAAPGVASEGNPAEPVGTLVLAGTGAVSLDPAGPARRHKGGCPLEGAQG